MTITLVDLGYDEKESYTPTKDEDFPYIGLEHVEPNTLHLSSYGSSTEVNSSKNKFRKGDILFGTMRPYFRKLIIAPFDGVCSTEFCVIRPQNLDERDFLFYAMAQKTFIEYATTNSNGARPRTKWELFSDFKLGNFSKQERIKIGFILSAYDDLFENNRRRIQLLEQSARLLYREWFVHLRFPAHEHVRIIDGVPEGWEKTNALDIMDVLSGGTPKTSVPDFWDGGIPFFTPKDTTDSPYVYDTEKNITEQGLSNCSSQLYLKDTIFITARGTVGNLNLAQTPMAMNQSCYALIGKEPLTQYFLYCALHAAIEQFKSRAVGAVFDAIIRDTFKHIPFVIPSKKIITDFTEIVTPYFKQIDNLFTQNRKLTTARDILLPRLMNGAITV